MKLWYIYLILINVVTFFAYMTDKIKAMKHKWRISEAALLVLAFAGGALGALCGMLVFRHKIRKPKFYLLVPLFLILQAAFLWIYII